MPLLIKKRVIDTDKFRVGRLARVVQGGIGYNGTIDKITNEALTLSVWIGSIQKAEITLSAYQLSERNFDVFICTDNMEDLIDVSEEDVTRESEKDVFDVRAAAPGQFARWTLDGTVFNTGVVESVAESQIRINTAQGVSVIKVPSALKPGFLNRFSDTINSGSVKWTVIE